MKIQVALLSILAVLTFSSCRKIVGEGPIVKETRNLSDYDGIHLSVPGTLFYTQANDFKVEIEAQQNIIDVIETYLVNGTELRIKMKNNVNIRKHDPIRVYVSGPTVRNLTVSGSGNIKVPQPVQSSDIRMGISGSGNIEVSRLQATQVTATISGSGDLSIRDGNANHTSANVSGSGNIDFLSFVSRKANAVISGSGNIRLHVSDELDARISGSGEIIYKGTPVVTTHISGSGRVAKY